MKKYVQSLSVALLISVLIYGLLYVYADEWFYVRRYKVNGPFLKVSREQVQDKLSQLNISNLFSLNKSAITKSLSELPWLKNIDISRRWPGTIVINLTEYLPIAKWGDKALIDQQGHVFFAVIPSNLDLPVLRGEQQALNQLLQDFKNMSNMLSGVSLELKEIDKKPSSLTIRMNDGMNVILNNKESVKQLQRFIEIYPKLVSQKDKKLARVDMRYKHGLAVQWMVHNQ